MATANTPQVLPQSIPPLDNRGGDTKLPPLFSQAWWLFFNAVSLAIGTLQSALDVVSALDFVFGGSKLVTIGAIPVVTAAGTLGESSLTDDGTAVSGTEPLHLDSGAAPQDSEVTLKANGAGVLSLNTNAVDSVEVSFDNEIVAGVRIARATSCFSIYKTANTLNIYGKTGAVVDAAVTQDLLVTIDLATGDVDTAGVYEVAGTQVVGPQGAALTAASAYGGGIFGAVYTVAEQTLANALVTQVLNLKTRLDQAEARLQAHGLIA